MNILGLTGSIGMGKTRTAEMFRSLGVPVFDADKTVHDLMAKGGEAVSEVENAFPGVVKDNAVDRAKLGDQVFGKADDLKKLEAILHPKVRASRGSFLEDARAQDAPLAVLDIPLLFETGGENQCTHIAVVSAPEQVQAERVLSRPNMTPEKFESILKSQVPDAEKRERADFVLMTDQGPDHTLNKVREIATMLGHPT
jgi:dephospho-CoA kinase